MSIAAEPPGGSGQAGALSAHRAEQPDGSGLDVETFAALYARHRDALHHYCRKKAHDPALVEDIVQDVFERAFASRSQFDARREFWPWLASIAARVCIDAHRRAVSTEARHDRYGRETVREPVDVTSRSVLDAFEHQKLARAIAELPDKQRAVLGLFAIDGWSQEQIGQHFGYSKKAVKSLICRARATLREATGRWAGALVGAGRLTKAWVQRGMARSIAWWPSQGWLLPGGDLCRKAGVVLAVAVLAGGDVATVRGDSDARNMADSGLALPAVAAPSSTVAPAGKPTSTPASPHTGPRRERPFTAAAGKAANDLVTPFVPDHGGDGPESIYVRSFATASSSDGDETIFVAGDVLGRTIAPTPPLLVSHDGGASWERRRAIGLAPVTKLLLPPDYPDDSRVFALTAEGLQVSYDDGDSFELLFAIAAGSDAAVAPGFQRGDPRILVVAGERLWEYRDDVGLLRPLPLTGGPEAHLVASVAFAADGPGAATVIVGTRLPNPVLADYALAVSRCTAQEGTAGPVLLCSMTRLPYVPSSALPIRLPSQVGATGLYIAFVTDPLVSWDGGRTFQAARRPADEDLPYWIHDLAAVPSSAGRKAVIAQTTYDTADGWAAFGAPLAITVDGGRRWAPVHVGLPQFESARAVTVTATGRIVAAGYGGGLACSADDGRTWGRTCPPASSTS